MPVYNLEDDLPTLAEAKKELKEILINEKKRKSRYIKIIHGYGSHGYGGKLRFGLRKSLANSVTEKGITEIIPGEKFYFDQNLDSLLTEYPDLISDPDFDRYNPGITIILL